MEKIRKPIAAGTFYPSDKDTLTGLINNLIDTAFVEKPPLKSIYAVIVPHAGYIYSGSVAACAYKNLINKNTRNYILLGPSHQFNFENLVQDTNDFWKTPLGLVPVKHTKGIASSPLPHEVEHSLEVQVPFLQGISKNFTITPILASISVDYKNAAERLEKLINRNSILVVSTDLSHYYPSDVATEKDKGTIEQILSLNSEALEKSVYEACGKTAVLVLIEIAKKLEWRAKLLKYGTSGDTSGNYTNVVGYASIAFFEDEV